MSHTIARLTLDQYDRMIAAGIFDETERRRIEFIHGELREMTPIGPEHEEIVDFLTTWSIKNAPSETIRVRIQNSFGIPQLDSAPEPDLAWVNQRSYAAGRPSTTDVLLIVEVAASSLAYDRGEKAELYAVGGIQDYWIVNLYDRTVEVHRDPKKGVYESSEVFRAGDLVSPLCWPGAVLEVEKLFAALG